MRFHLPHGWSRQMTRVFRSPLLGAAVIPWLASRGAAQEEPNRTLFHQRQRVGRDERGPAARRQRSRRGEADRRDRSDRCGCERQDHRWGRTHAHARSDRRSRASQHARREQPRRDGERNLGRYRLGRCGRCYGVSRKRFTTVRGMGRWAVSDSRRPSMPVICPVRESTLGQLYQPDIRTRRSAASAVSSSTRTAAVWSISDS